MPKRVHAVGLSKPSSWPASMALALALGGGHFHAREALAGIVVGDHPALGVQGGADLVGRGRALGVPAVAPRPACPAPAPGARTAWTSRQRRPPRRRRRCGRRSRGRATEIERTFSTGRPSMAAMPALVAWGFCEGCQTVTPSAR